MSWRSQCSHFSDLPIVSVLKNSAFSASSANRITPEFSMLFAQSLGPPPSWSASSAAISPQFTAFLNSEETIPSSTIYRVDFD